MDSFTSEKSRSNPWENEIKHPCDKFLELRSKSQHGGLLTREELQLRHEESPLLRGLDVVKSAEEARKKLAEVKQRCIELSLDNRACDVLHSEELKRKLGIVEVLLQSFEVCVTEAEKVQQTLMQPYQGTFMKIEYKYHESVIKLFSNSVKVLNDLQKELETLQWHKENQIGDAELRKVLETLTSSVVEMEKGLRIAEKSKSVLVKKCSAS